MYPYVNIQREGKIDTHDKSRGWPRVMAESAEEVDGSKMSPERMRVCSRSSAKDDGDSRRDGMPGEDAC